jgi:hypothetical protein
LTSCVWRLLGREALISGTDSGVGRAAAPDEPEAQGGP